jgi:hypothetical protein
MVLLQIYQPSMRDPVEARMRQLLRRQINTSVEDLGSGNDGEKAYDQTCRNSPLKSDILRHMKMSKQRDAGSIDDRALDQEPT